jgi:branched-chain amino acid transport system permease protein
LGVLPSFMRSPYWLHILILCFFYVVASLSLRTIMISGQFSIAHGAFMGLGAYLSAILGVSWGVSPWLSIPVATLITTLIGIVICFPFARLRALYYAMGTMFFGVVVVQVINAGGKVTGGYSGLTQIPLMFSGNKTVWYYVALAFLILTAIALYRFEFCRIGVDLKAVSQSYVVAQSVGINEFFYRILAVAVGSFFVGLSGALYAHYNGMISTTSFNFTATMWILMYVLVGGLTHFSGPIVGTFILFLLPEVFRELKTYSPLIPAGLLLVVVYVLPGGLASIPGVIARAAKAVFRKQTEKSDAA